MTSVRANILFSGGIDSMCCAHLLQESGFDVSATFVDYGQAALHSERSASQFLADNLGIPHSIIRCEHARAFGEGELTGRNLFFVSAVLFMMPVKPGLIGLGIHAGTPYFDCSSEFFRSTSRLISDMTDGAVDLVAPFLDWEKHEIYQYAIDNNLPIEASYSCESQNRQPCGECLSCRDRAILQDLQKSAQ